LVSRAGADFEKTFHVKWKKERIFLRRKGNACEMNGGVVLEDDVASEKRIKTLK